MADKKLIDVSDVCVDPHCDPKNPRTITFEEVSAARDRIKKYIQNTPCIKSHISDLVKTDIYIKQEFLQFTGSFKERGARNALMLLPKEKMANGVVSASTGNHGQSIAYQGKQMGIPVTVVMPAISTIVKIQKCRSYGANVILHGNILTDSIRYARTMAFQKGCEYINGFDHPDIIAGQGTMAFEILEEVPDLDTIVLPVGGGSLLSGVGVVLKKLKPDVKIVGVESINVPSFSSALKYGKPVHTEIHPTLADGLSIPKVGVNSYETGRKVIDKMITVTEDWIGLSILRLMELDKCVVEGAAACSIATVISGKIKDLNPKKIVCVLTDGNIDAYVLARTVERGLASDGRLVKFTVEVTDRVGGLAELGTLLDNAGVVMKEMEMERAWVTHDVFTVKILCIVEARDYQHVLQLQKILMEKYKTVEFIDLPATGASKLALPLF